MDDAGNALALVLGEGEALDVVMQSAAEDVPKMMTEAKDLAYAEQVLGAVKAGGSLKDWLNFGKVATMFGRFGGDSDAITTAMNIAKGAKGWLVGSFAVSTGVSFTSLLGGGAPISVNENVWRLPHIPGLSDLWDYLENLTTTPGGLTTAPLGPAATAFRLFSGSW